MKKNEQKGFLGKIFGGSKKDTCCAIELEEIPENKPESENKKTDKQPQESQPKKGGCGCCG
jgi:hypothetical protein